MSLLLDALRLAQKTREDARGTPAAQREPQPSPSPRPLAPASKSARSSLFALGLAIAIFLGAVSAWHQQPQRAPAKLKIDPSELKLDSGLDLTRKPPPAPPNQGTTRP